MFNFKARVVQQIIALNNERKLDIYKYIYISIDFFSAIYIKGVSLTKVCLGFLAY